MISREEERKPDPSEVLCYHSGGLAKETYKSHPQNLQVCNENRKKANYASQRENRHEMKFERQNQEKPNWNQSTRKAKLTEL